MPRPPGVYLPDASEGIASVADLPRPRVVERSFNHAGLPCPACGRAGGHAAAGPAPDAARAGGRHPRRAGRPARDLLPALLRAVRPALQRRHARLGHARRALHEPGRGRGRAVGGRGRPAVPVGQLAPVAGPPGVRPVRHDPELGGGGGGGKSLAVVGGAHPDDALAGFSGYVAVDELYDGPFCVLSIVDSRTYRRLARSGCRTTPRRPRT